MIIIFKTIFYNVLIMIEICFDGFSIKKKIGLSLSSVLKGDNIFTGYFIAY